MAAVPRYRLAAAVALVGVLVVGFGRCAENVPPARTAGDCGGPGKTCAVDPLAAVTTTAAATKTTAAAATKTTAAPATKTTAAAATKTTAAKTTPRTAAAPETVRAGIASDRAAVTVRYDVSGLDAGDDRGAALREIVPVDETFRRDADASGGNAGDARNVTERPVVPPTVDNGTAANNTHVVTSAAAANGTVAPVVAANGTVAPPVVITTTTTTAVRAKAARNDAQVVRYVSDKYCYCDLIHGSCDIDCCCDTDCTNHDLKSFTSCSDHAESSSIKPESILFDSSLFYVVVENVPSDYFYPERDAIESESQVATSLRNRDVFTWQHGEKSGRLSGAPPPQPHRTDPAYNSYDLTHKSLRWMYTGARGDNSSSDIKPFGLKSSAFDSLCTVEQPVEYLTAKETNCQTYVSNLTDACNNGSALSFESYFGDKGVFNVLQPIYSGSQKTEKFGLVAVRATAHHRCVSADGTPYDCRVPPGHGHHPVYAGGACRRVVDAVEYRLRHNGTGGVRAVDVHFRHRDVTDAGRAMRVGQRFGAQFDRFGGAATGPAEQPYERSGKPGYATGRPVLVATTAAAAGRPLRPEPMSLPEPDGRGRCEPRAAGSQRRRTVDFAVAADVRCRLRVRVPTRRARPDKWSGRADEPAAAGARADVCRGVQNETVAALGDYEGVLVAGLGDPDVTRWTPAVVVRPPAPQPSSADDPSSCPAVTDGVHIRVLYAYAGALDRPRATVLGVLVNYTATAVTVTAETVRDRRDDDKGGDNADDDAGANDAYAVAEIPIRATVVFVDLTRPPARTFAEPPTYEFRLPEDFYYPFWSSSDGVRPPDPPTRPSRSSAVRGRSRSEKRVSVFSLTFAAIVVVARGY